MIDATKADQLISSILDTPSESRSVELKPSIAWGNVKNNIQLQDIIKSIIGMSNVRDGGKVILGIRQNPDRRFDVSGMNSQSLESFDRDNIYQVIRAYSNPEPRFEISNIEYSGKYFIVFSVQEFLYSPVICIKNGSNNGAEPLIKGALYIRTLKPETKRVTEETEMREIINLAIEKEIEVWSPRIKKILTGPSIVGSWVDSAKQFANEFKDLNL